MPIVVSAVFFSLSPSDICHVKTVPK